jgi:HEAT repeat protein
LYWFHPLVWTAAKQLRAESERACDDLALLCGARASDYAEHLLDIVTSVRHDSTPAVALAMARRKEFEGRMLAILDPELQHSSPSRWQSAALIGSLAVVAVIVGAAAPTQRVEARTVAAAPVAQVSSSKGTVQSAQQPAQQGVPKANPPRAPEYPNSGVPGVASKAERMIEQATQVTRTTVSTQTLIDTHTTENKSTSTNVNPGKLLDEKSMGDIGGIAARSVEKIAQQKGGAANAVRSPDDRPVLLANVLRTDTSASLRRIAAWGLSEYADQQVAADALATALRRDSNAGVREMAAWALGEGDDRNTTGTAALTAALRSDADVKVRATAAWALGQVGDESSTESLAAALSDSDESVRMRAGWALGRVSPRQAPRALVAMLQNRDPRMRELTAWALYEIEDPSTAPALNAALKTESDKNLQIAYIRALAAMGEKSVDALRGLLESKDQQVRSMAIRALAGGHAAGPWPWPWPEPRPWP